MVLAISALGAAACGGSSSSGGAKAGARGPLEQTHLKIGIPKNELGALPLFTGVDKGYFKDQGLDVTIDDSFASYQDTLKALGDGKVDLVYDDYVHAVLQMSTGTYRLQLVAEGYTAGDDSVQLLSKPTGRRNEDQARAVFDAHDGFLVPMTGTGNPDTDYTVPTVMLMTRLPDVANSLKIRNDTADAHLKSMTAAAISEKLSGSADTNLAGVVAEPYLSASAGSDSLSKVMDLTRGSTQAMPMGGYFAKQDFAVTNTNTFKAFTAGLNQAKTVTGQRALAMSEMQAHYGAVASSTVVASISFGGFPTTVSVPRVSRVLTLMRDLGLAVYFNIDTMMPPDAERGQS
ncbi:MAG: ABC transporter substrate-binding protein [Catenulispora sp.]|nr:ABC transporter substrate-binding protein [Catenulispora sp.]